MRCPHRPLFAVSIAALTCLPLLGGCDMLGIESSEKVAATRDADGRAIGGACRHAARAIEDCYTLNKKADKAAIFAGWRDMNDYMRENKIDAVAPQMAAKGAKAHGDEDAAPADAQNVKTAAAGAEGGHAARPEGGHAPSEEHASAKEHAAAGSHAGADEHAADGVHADVGEHPAEEHAPAKAVAQAKPEKEHRPE